MKQFTSNFFYLLIRVFGRHFISDIFTVVASVFDDMEKTAGDHSTSWTNHFLWVIFPFIKERLLQSIGVLVGLPTNPAHKYGSHWEVHWIEIRAWGGHIDLSQKDGNTDFSKVLDKNWCVCWWIILHECIKLVPISVLEPWDNLGFKHVFVDLTIDLEPHFNKD